MNLGLFNLGLSAAKGYFPVEFFRSTHFLVVGVRIPCRAQGAVLVRELGLYQAQLNTFDRQQGKNLGPFNDGLSSVKDCLHIFCLCRKGSLTSRQHLKHHKVPGHCFAMVHLRFLLRYKEITALDHN